MDKEKIGKYIRELRESKNITQEQLAKEMHISRSNLSDIENGKTEPSFEKIQMISELFNVNMSCLYNGEESLNKKEKINRNTKFIKKNKKRKSRKIICFILVIILLLFMTYLLYYFICSYNTVRVYKIFGESLHFSTNEGIFFVSKEHMYFSLSVNPKNNEEIKSITLRYKDENKDELIQEIGGGNNFFITDYYNYNEFFDYDTVLKENGKFYILVEYADYEEIINLSIVKEYENNSLIFIKDKSITEDADDKVFIEDHNIPDKILKDFAFENNAYNYEKKMKNFTLKMGYFPDAEIFYASEEYNDYYEVWQYYIHSDELHYNKSTYDLKRLETDRILTQNDELYKHFIDEYYKKYFK